MTPSGDKETDCWAEARASKKQGNEAASILDFASLQAILHPVLGLTALRHPNKLPTEQTMHEGSSAHRTSQPKLQVTLPVGPVTVEGQTWEVLKSIYHIPAWAGAKQPACRPCHEVRRPQEWRRERHSGPNTPLILVKGPFSKIAQELDFLGFILEFSFPTWLQNETEGSHGWASLNHIFFTEELPWAKNTHVTSDKKILQVAADWKSSCEDTVPLEKRKEKEPGRKLEYGAQGTLSPTPLLDSKATKSSGKERTPGPMTLVPAVPWLCRWTYSPVWLGRDDFFVWSLLWWPPRDQEVPSSASYKCRTMYKWHYMRCVCICACMHKYTGIHERLKILELFTNLLSEVI